MQDSVLYRSVQLNGIYPGELTPTSNKGKQVHYGKTPNKTVVKSLNTLSIENIKTRILIPREGFSGNNSSRLVKALKPNNATCPMQEPTTDPSLLKL